MPTNFYFGYLDFPAQSELDDFPGEVPGDDEELRRRYLYEYVNRPDVIHAESDQEALWRFGNCEIIDGWIFGTLGRNFMDVQTRWDPDEEDYKIEEEEIEVANVSYFIIFPEVPGVVFNRKNRIGPKQFRDAFVSGYNEEYTGSPIRLEIMRTGGEYDYLDFVKNASRVHRLEFDLEPTNPYPHDEMELLDDHLRGMNSDDFTMVAEVEDEDDDSLEANEELLRSAGAMADGDYGSFRAKFIDLSGEEKSYNSKGEYATEDLSEPEEPEDLTTYSEILHDKLQDLVFGTGIGSVSLQQNQEDTEDESEPGDE